MKGRPSPILLSAALALAGCSLEQPAPMPPPEAQPQAVDVSATGFNHAILLSGQYGSFVRTRSGYYQGVWPGDDVFTLGVSYRCYDEALNRSGWTALEVFRRKAGGYTVGFEYTKDALFGGNEYALHGGYSKRLNDTVLLETTLGYGLLADGGNINLLLGGVLLGYYVRDDIRVAADWRYVRYWDDAGNLTYHFYGLGGEYLLNIERPLLIGLKYEREQTNGSPASSDVLSFRAEWFATARLKGGLSVMMNFGYPARHNVYVLGGGLRVSEAATIDAGYRRMEVMGGGPGFDNVFVEAEVRF